MREKSKDKVFEEAIAIEETKESFFISDSIKEDFYYAESNSSLKNKDQMIFSISSTNDYAEFHILKIAKQKTKTQLNIYADKNIKASFILSIFDNASSYSIKEGDEVIESKEVEDISYEIDFSEENMYIICIELLNERV